MRDCIYREEAIRICEKLRDKTDNDDMAFALNWAIQSIKGIPAADVRPVVRSFWGYNDGDNIPYCDNCGMPQDTPCDFCPSCWADMRADDETT